MRVKLLVFFMFQMKIVEIFLIPLAINPLLNYYVVSYDKFIKSSNQNSVESDGILTISIVS